MEENQNKNINRVSAICISNNHHDDDDNNAYFNSLPVRYRFAPREDVLIIEFLLKKLAAAEYDNSLMISQQKENSYGSCFPPPALNNFDQNLLPVNTTLNNNFGYNVPVIQSYPLCYSYGLQPIYDQACYDCMKMAIMNHHLEPAAEEPPLPQPIPASENNSLEFNKQPSTSGPDYTC
ncbi:hypothetical protein GH714_041092 [Hevea brasiliensis]|uniref:NAC domain-containing protein n=1 Tax=Hevea brasiliensis TaxID=3981 RepID=A0A6A6MVX0_HEVBR|nr:hypothetical protein GH714_041092 [Hevea brasiliensis]